MFLCKVIQYRFTSYLSELQSPVLSTYRETTLNEFIVQFSSIRNLGAQFLLVNVGFSTLYKTYFMWKSARLWQFWNSLPIEVKEIRELLSFPSNCPRWPIIFPLEDNKHLFTTRNLFHIYSFPYLATSREQKREHFCHWQEKKPVFTCGLKNRKY